MSRHRLRLGISIETISTEKNVDPFHWHTYAPLFLTVTYIFVDTEDIFIKTKPVSVCPL